MDLFWGEDGRLRSGWRFGLSVFFFFVVNSFAVDIANAWAGPSDRKFELLYRPLLMVFLIAGFSVLLKTLDRVDGNPLPAMGLVPRYFLPDVWVGFIGGAVMVSLAVLPIAIGYHLGFHVVFCRHSLKLALRRAVHPRDRSDGGRSGVPRLPVSASGRGNGRHRSDCVLVSTVRRGSSSESTCLGVQPDQHDCDWYAAGYRLPTNSSSMAALGIALRLESDTGIRFRASGQRNSTIRSGGAWNCRWPGMADRRSVWYRRRSSWNPGHRSRVMFVCDRYEKPSQTRGGRVEKEKTLTGSDSRGIQLSQGSGRPGRLDP